jgi:hypothetical protein
MREYASARRRPVTEILFYSVRQVQYLPAACRSRQGQGFIYALLRRGQPATIPVNRQLLEKSAGYFNTDIEL